MEQDRSALKLNTLFTMTRLKLGTSKMPPDAAYNALNAAFLGMSNVSAADLESLKQLCTTNWLNATAGSAPQTKKQAVEPDYVIKIETLRELLAARPA